MSKRAPVSGYRDEFPDTPARRAVMAMVRGFGALYRQMSPYYARFGLKPPQYQMLMVLNRLRDCQLTQRKLAKELFVSFPNVTVMLKRLEGAGLIQRTVNDTDRREKFVRITPRGRALLKRIWKHQQEQLEQVTAGLQDEERLELARLVNKMIAGHSSTGEVRRSMGEEQ